MDYRVRCVFPDQVSRMLAKLITSASASGTAADILDVRFVCMSCILWLAEIQTRMCEELLRVASQLPAVARPVLEVGHTYSYIHLSRLLSSVSGTPRGVFEIKLCRLYRYRYRIAFWDDGLSAGRARPLFVSEASRRGSYSRGRRFRVGKKEDGMEKCVFSRFGFVDALSFVGF